MSEEFPEGGIKLKELLEHKEKELINAAMAKAGGVVKAAKILGLKRSTLSEKLRRFKRNGPTEIQNG